MADSIRVSLPTSGDETDMGTGPGPADDPIPPASTPGGPGGSQHGGQRPQKRRRIPVACGACRSKKSRVRLDGPPGQPGWKFGSRTCLLASVACLLACLLEEIDG